MATSAERYSVDVGADIKSERHSIATYDGSNLDGVPMRRFSSAKTVATPPPLAPRPSADASPAAAPL
jgi:hypothetical protein